MNQIVVNGDNLKVLATYPDNYFDAVVTDPPYGLGKEPDAVQLMKDWVEHGYHEIKGSGFMGKEWDAFVPQPKFWKEVFRVLKHGGHVLAFYGTRTYDWGVMAMRFAGFEVRDTIYWHYGSGFPKSHNVGKAMNKLKGAEREVIGVVKGMGKQNPEWNGVAKGRTENSFKEEYDKTAPATEEAKQWEGWGSALKPASEPIVLARKPLEKGLSIAENVLKYGTGGINIDGCRVQTSEDLSDMKAFGVMPKNKSDNKGFSRPWMNDQESILEKQNAALDKMKDLGRFPANLILSHSAMCQLNGLKRVKSHNPDNKGENVGFNPSGDKLYGKGNGITNNQGYAENGQETVEDWTCHPDCPIKIMDEQSGESKSTASVRNNKKRNEDNVYGGGKGIPQISLESNHSDKGGASRFFYCAKASKSERNKGLEGFEEKKRANINKMMGESGNFKTGSGNDRTIEFKNFHPTVKPVKLMQYLVRLVTPPNGKVLDPFCGSGTTGIACKLEGFDFVGIEQDPEYTKIAQARINNWIEENEQKAKNVNPKATFVQQDLF